MKNEDSTIIKGLTKNFESAQSQCNELIEIIEKLTNENRHLRGNYVKYSLHLVIKIILDRINVKYEESNSEHVHNEVIIYNQYKTVYI